MLKKILAKVGAGLVIAQLSLFVATPSSAQPPSATEEAASAEPSPNWSLWEFFLAIWDEVVTLDEPDGDNLAPAGNETESPEAGPIGDPFG